MTIGEMFNIDINYGICYELLSNVMEFKVFND